MVMIMGTSICHMVIGDSLKVVPGMCGVVEDGITPGTFGYEAGQSAVGDIFGWFVEQNVPAHVEKEAAAAGLGVHSFLEREAAKLKPGESGLIALDWHNGNRSTSNLAG
jgi:L-ribulokinase